MAIQLKLRSVEAPLAWLTMKDPADTFESKIKVVAKAAAALAVVCENTILVPGATVGAGTVVVVALAASVNSPEQFNRP